MAEEAASALEVERKEALLQGKPDASLFVVDAVGVCARNGWSELGRRTDKALCCCDPFMSTTSVACGFSPPLSCVLVGVRYRTFLVWLSSVVELVLQSCLDENLHKWDRSTKARQDAVLVFPPRSLKSFLGLQQQVGYVGVNT